MTREIGILHLSNDLLRDILDCIEADPDNPYRSVDIDRRAYLSVESFRPPSPPSSSKAQDIGHFRLTCRRFADLGAAHQFTRVATRFSHAGFQRLESIASSPHLAKHTKKFSYMIPDFFENGRDNVKDLLIQAGSDLQLDPTYFQLKASAQKQIVETGEDVRVLKKAMLAFRTLQHVQILRLQTVLDRALLDYIQEDPEESLPLVNLHWSLACTHATKSIGQALSESKSSFSRFSGPMMRPEGALALIDSIPKHVDFIAERLTCLELHFDDGEELQGRMLELSSLFKYVFTAARNIQVLHIGFPSRQPLELPLETLFHNIQWEKLRAFGVQAWRLNASEIIDLARRHRKTLRGLRLRDVLLVEGSWWRDVLQMLHDEMETLEWVSLRRIDYSSHFNTLMNGTMEVPDYPPSVSDSDDEDDNFHTHMNMEGVEDFDWDDDSDDQSNADSDHGPEANDIALSPDTPVSLPFCTCSRDSLPASSLEIGDNGFEVVPQQRKLWEKWVIGRCPEHGSV